MEIFILGTKFRFKNCEEYEITFITDDGYYALFENSDGHKDIMSVDALETKFHDGEIKIL